MGKIIDNWKLIALAFAIGFALAPIAWMNCVIPTGIDFLWFEYSFDACDGSQKPEDLCDDYSFEIVEPSGGYNLENG